MEALLVAISLSLPINFFLNKSRRRNRRLDCSVLACLLLDYRFYVHASTAEHKNPILCAQNK